MKKLNQSKYLRLQKKRERKRFKRKRHRHLFFDKMAVLQKDFLFKKTIDDRTLKDFNFDLHKFLEEEGNIPLKKLGPIVKIPQTFSLEDNYNDTILTLALIRKSILEFKGQRLEIDFTNCQKADFSGLFLLKVIIDEYFKELKRLQTKLLMYKVVPTLIIRRSLNNSVNLKLLANALIPNAEVVQTELNPVSILDLITGRKAQEHYAENKKGFAATSIREYVNKGLQRHNFELNSKGISHLDGLISEILNNAEDHSLFEKWYVFANLFETSKKESDTEVIGEINLAFLNFGYSIFQGFEKTKEANNTIYQDMDALYQIVSGSPKGKSYSKENLFTLYALQEGNSRLKYEKESRGTGTMKFINSFMNLGDYQDESKGCIPHLLIYSGTTMIKCDNKYKPFNIDGVFYLSLNDEKDLTRAPESSHLKTLKSRFPGTLLCSKIYLNQTHLKKKVKKNETPKN